MTTAKRKSPTQANGGTDDGVLYTNAVDIEIEALWARIATRIGTVAGTANAITGTTADTDVDAQTAYSGLYILRPALANTGGVTINLDSIGSKNVLDSDGATLTAGALTASRDHLLAYDGTALRVLSSGQAASALNAAPDLMLRDEKTTNTAGGSFNNGSFLTRTLNTVTRNNLSGASLASNQFTLPAGSFFIEWEAPAHQAGPHQTRLQNVTDATTVETGTSASNVAGSDAATTLSRGAAFVTITSAKVYELQHKCTTTRATDGFGNPTNLAAKEVYSVVNVWKVGSLPTEIDGIPGGAVTLELLFSTTTADADPGAGTMRLNNATQNTATAFYVDLLDARAVDITAILDNVLTASSSTVKGSVRLVKYDDPTKWLTFNLTAWTTASGYRKFTVANVASSAASPFANGDRLLFAFSRTGDKGDLATGYTTTATAAGTTTLTSSSTYNQYFTGSSTQTLVLPVTSTLVQGNAFRVVNKSTGNVTVQSSGGNTILVMGPNSEAEFVCILTSGTTAASWDAKLRYEGLPQNAQSAAYTTVLSDAGKHLFHPAADTTARTWTIDSNANVPYPIGTTITFVAEGSSGTITIAITTDTLVLSPGGTTGSRTLAPHGVATAIKVTATKWYISGSGLT